MSPTASGARGAIWTCHCWRSEDHADGELGAAGNLRKILDSTEDASRPEKWGEGLVWEELHHKTRYPFRNE